MIVRITFKTEKEEWMMLFGNSYKKWHTQAFEYIFRHFVDNRNGQTQKESYERALTFIVKAEKSQSAWKSFGGLKWCSHENFQHELNREDRQDNDTDNPNARKYSNMRFVRIPNWYVKKQINNNF